jgi:pyochelin biosynthetic protein PchC
MLSDAPSPIARLVCLPYSGGNAESYGAWDTALLPAVEVLAAQYPGHGDRYREPPLTDVRAMSAEIVAELRQLPGLPTVLFGHSLGAVVAYETATAFPVSGLLVSSCPPPGVAARTPGSDAELWSEICRLGGVDTELVANTELAESVLPLLRADITAHERYRPDPGAAALSCPVRCYHGANDPLIGADLTAWASVTTGPFNVVERPGHHFHAFRTAEPLLADILAFLSPTRS